MPTWRVKQEIVQVATHQRGRCRYVELDEMTSTAGVVGPADIFVSHAWGAPFGTLVAAACHVVGAQSDARLWIDVFAVRQW